MEYIKIGKIVNTHALKGEVRIISNFEYKDQIFVVGKHLLIGRFYKDEIINSYRVHKNYDMVTFVNKNYINDVIEYKGEPIYVLKSDLIISDDDILIEDMIGMEIIFDNKSIGLVEDYRNDNGNRLIYVNNKYIPFNMDFIERVDKSNKKIYYKDIGGLL